MKTGEAARGVPLSGLATKVAGQRFLISLSNAETGEPRNIALLAGRAWFDVPLIYRNRAAAAFSLSRKAPPASVHSPRRLPRGGRSPPAPAPPAVAPRPEPLLDPIRRIRRPASAIVVQLSSQRSQADAEAAYRALQEEVSVRAGVPAPRSSCARTSATGASTFARRWGRSSHRTKPPTSVDDLGNAGGQCVVQESRTRRNMPPPIGCDAGLAHRARGATCLSPLAIEFTHLLPREGESASRA